MKLYGAGILLILCWLGACIASDNGVQDLSAGQLAETVVAGRRGSRGRVTTRGSFTVTSSNRAGNDELGEAEDAEESHTQDVAYSDDGHVKLPQAELELVDGTAFISVIESTDEDEARRRQRRSKTDEPEDKDEDKDRITEQSDANQLAVQTNCPFNRTELKNNPKCEQQWCNTSTAPVKDPEDWKKVHWSQINCPEMCNPNCNPKIPHISFGSVTYIPGAHLQNMTIPGAHLQNMTIPVGHQHCADKITVRTKEHRPSNEKDVQYKVKNYAVTKSTNVAVCGKCASDEFMLHPAFVVGNRVVGVCEKLTDHWLSKQLETQCNNQSKPCGGEVVSHCEKFVGEFGDFRISERGNHNVPRRTHSMVNGQLQPPPANSSLAFTCSRLYAHDFAATTPTIRLKQVKKKHLKSWTPGGPDSQLQAFAMGSGKSAAEGRQPVVALAQVKLYRLVQAKIASCYSTNEEPAPGQDMTCVNRKEIKTCHMRDYLLPNVDMTTAIPQFTTQPGHFKETFDALTEQSNKYNQKGKERLSDKDKKEALATLPMQYRELYNAIAAKVSLEHFSTIKEQIFTNLTTKGVGQDENGWKDCDELDEKVAISLA